MTSQDAVFGNDGDDDDWGEDDEENEDVSWAAAQMQVFIPADIKIYFIIYVKMDFQCNSILNRVSQLQMKTQ